MDKKAKNENLFKWLLVIPAFLLCFIIMSAFKFAADLMIIHPLVGSNQQLQFILDHLYYDLFVVGASIYFSCLVAPSYKVRLSLIYAVLILVATPRRLVIAQLENFYGYYPWKIPLLISFYVISVLIPVLLLLREKHANQKLNSDKDHISTF